MTEALLTDLCENEDIFDVLFEQIAKDDDGMALIKAYENSPNRMWRKQALRILLRTKSITIMQYLRASIFKWLKSSDTDWLTEILEDDRVLAPIKMPSVDIGYRVAILLLRNKAYYLSVTEFMSFLQILVTDVVEHVQYPLLLPRRVVRKSTLEEFAMFCHQHQYMVEVVLYTLFQRMHLEQRTELAKQLLDNLFESEEKYLYAYAIKAISHLIPIELTQPYYEDAIKIIEQPSCQAAEDAAQLLLSVLQNFSDVAVAKDATRMLMQSKQRSPSLLKPRMPELTVYTALSPRIPSNIVRQHLILARESLLSDSTYQIVLVARVAALLRPESYLDAVKLLFDVLVMSKFSCHVDIFLGYIEERFKVSTVLSNISLSELMEATDYICGVIDRLENYKPAVISELQSLISPLISPLSSSAYAQSIINAVINALAKDALLSREALYFLSRIVMSLTDAIHSIDAYKMILLLLQKYSSSQYESIFLELFAEPVLCPFLVALATRLDVDTNNSIREFLNDLIQSDDVDTRLLTLLLNTIPISFDADCADQLAGLLLATDSQARQPIGESVLQALLVLVPQMGQPMIKTIQPTIQRLVLKKLDDVCCYALVMNLLIAMLGRVGDDVEILGPKEMLRRLVKLSSDNKARDASYHHGYFIAIAKYLDPTDADLLRIIPFVAKYHTKFKMIECLLVRAIDEKLSLEHVIKHARDALISWVRYVKEKQCAQQDFESFYDLLAVYLSVFDDEHYPDELLRAVLNSVSANSSEYRLNLKASVCLLTATAPASIKLNYIRTARPVIESIDPRHVSLKQSLCSVQLFADQIDAEAVVALVHSLFNLLPVYTGAPTLLLDTIKVLAVRMVALDVPMDASTVGAYLLALIDLYQCDDIESLEMLSGVIEQTMHLYRAAFLDDFIASVFDKLYSHSRSANDTVEKNVFILESIKHFVNHQLSCGQSFSVTAQFAAGYVCLLNSRNFAVKKSAYEFIFYLLTLSSGMVNRQSIQSVVGSVPPGEALLSIAGLFGDSGEEKKEDVTSSYAPS